MRILLLCDKYPDSYRDGLLLRVLHLARQLTKRHTIDLLCFHAGTPVGEPTQLFDKVWTAQPPQPGQVKRSAGFWNTWSPKSLYARSPVVVDLLEQVVDPAAYDVVWDAGGSMFLHLPTRWDRVPLVVDLVDDMVLTLTRALRTASGAAQRLRLAKYLFLQWRYERHSMRRAQCCCVVSEVDAACFRRVSDVPVHVVQNGVDVDFFSPTGRASIPGRLVFEGSMAFRPNQEAAILLAEQVMPLVWRVNAEASLTLVGRDPSPEILALRNDRITVTGSVDDVRPFIDEAQVFVCPLTSGAGIKNKLLQAWAMGKAVVATSMSIGGLGAVDNENLLVRDSPQDIADGILTLLSDEDGRRSLGNSGRRRVMTHFGWTIKATQFESLLLNAISQKPRQRAA